MRLRLVALPPLLVLISLLGATAPAQAEPGDDILDVVGTLVDTRTDPPKPVPGVVINVEIDGEQVATGTSDAEGRYSIALPGTPDELVGEKIVVTLDTSTLPAGTTLTDEKNISRTVTIKTNFDIPIGYRIGPAVDESSEIVRKASQSLPSTALPRAAAGPRRARHLPRLRHHRPHELRARRADHVRCARRLHLPGPMGVGVPAGSPGRRSCWPAPSATRTTSCPLETAARPRHRPHRHDDRQHRSRHLPAQRLPVLLRRRQPPLHRGAASSADRGRSARSTSRPALFWSASHLRHRAGHRVHRGAAHPTRQGHPSRLGQPGARRRRRASTSTASSSPSGSSARPWPGSPASSGA